MTAVVCVLRSQPARSANHAGGHSSVEKTSFASNTSGSLAVKRGPRLRCSCQTTENRRQRTDVLADPPKNKPHGLSLQLFHHPVRPNVFPLHDVIDAAPCNLHDTEWSSAPTALCAAASETRSQKPERQPAIF